MGTMFLPKKPVEPESSAVDVEGMRARGLRLESVSRALARAGAEIYYGHAVEVEEGRDRGVLIYIPCSDRLLQHLKEAQS